MQFDTAVIWQTFPRLLRIWLTVVNVLLSLFVGVLIGLLACAGMLLGGPAKSWLSAAYVGLFPSPPRTNHHFWLYYRVHRCLERKAVGLRDRGYRSCHPNRGAYLAEIFRAGVRRQWPRADRGGTSDRLSSLSLLWTSLALKPSA